MMGRDWRVRRVQDPTRFVIASGVGIGIARELRGIPVEVGAHRGRPLRPSLAGRTQQCSRSRGGHRVTGLFRTRARIPRLDLPGRIGSRHTASTQIPDLSVEVTHRSPCAIATGSRGQVYRRKECTYVTG